MFRKFSIIYLPQQFSAKGIHVCGTSRFMHPTVVRVFVQLCITATVLHTCIATYLYCSPVYTERTFRRHPIDATQKETLNNQLTPQRSILVERASLKLPRSNCSIATQNLPSIDSLLAQCTVGDDRTFETAFIAHSHPIITYSRCPCTVGTPRQYEIM